MTRRDNDKRQLKYLWEHRHNHDDDPDLQQQITIINNQIGQIEDTGVGSGAYVHLQRSATQSIASTGELIDWDAVNTVIPRFEFHPDAGFPDLSDLPLTEVTIPLDGYYDVSLLLGWSSFTGGGSVSIVRNPSTENTTVWPPASDPGLWTTDDGQDFEGVAPAVPFVAGDTVGVFLDPDDASAQTLASASLAVYLVDRIGTTGRLATYYEAVVLADGPLAYWRLDEPSGTTAEDTAGHASGPFDGTYTNGPTLNQTGIMLDGSGSPSVEFNGSTEYVLGTDAAALEFTGSAPFTVEAWVSADLVGSSGHYFPIVSKLNAITPGSSHDGWVLQFQSNGSALKATVQRWTTTSVQVAESGFDYAVGTRYYVAATYDGTDLVLYVDGAEVDSDATSVSLPTTTVPWLIAAQHLSGSVDTGLGNMWNGHIDEVAIYGRALNVFEIEEHALIGGI